MNKTYKSLAISALMAFIISIGATSGINAKSDEDKPRDGLLRRVRASKVRKAYEKAEYLYTSKKFTESAEILRALITEQPELQDPYILLGKIYEAQGKWGEAVSIYRRLRELDPSCAPAFYGIARAASKISTMVDIAIESCQKLLEFEKNNPPRMAGIYYNMGLLYEQTGRIDNAKTAYLKAIQLDGKFALPRNNLAWLYADARENLDEALQLINFAIELQPKASAFYDTRGFIHYQRKEYQAAIRDFRLAIDLDPSNASYFFRMSMAYFKYAEQLSPKHPFKRRAAELLRSGDDAIQDKKKNNETLGPEY